jgi:hypothetical protein
MVAATLLAAASPATIRIEIRNASSAPMICELLAAHWYTPLPAILAQPGATATLTLAFDAARGEAVDDPSRKLPLETLFCGRPGRAWETRGTLDLQRLAAQAAATGTAHATCFDSGNALACIAAR